MTKRLKRVADGSPDPRTKNVELNVHLIDEHDGPSSDIEIRYVWLTVFNSKMKRTGLRMYKIVHDAAMHYAHTSGGLENR